MKKNRKCNWCDNNSQYRVWDNDFFEFMNVCSEHYESKNYEEQTRQKAYMIERDLKELIEKNNGNIVEGLECLVPAQLLSDILDIIVCLNIMLPNLKEENNFLENRIRQMVLSYYDE